MLRTAVSLLAAAGLVAVSVVPGWAEPIEAEPAFGGYPEDDALVPSEPRLAQTQDEFVSLWHIFEMDQPEGGSPPLPKPTLPVVDHSRYVVWFVEEPGLMADRHVFELLDGRLVWDHRGERGGGFHGHRLTVAYLIERSQLPLGELALEVADDGVVLSSYTVTIQPPPPPPPAPPEAVEDAAAAPVSGRPWWRVPVLAVAGVAAVATVLLLRRRRARVEP